MDQRKPALAGLPAFRRTPRQQAGVEPGVKEQKWPTTAMALSLFVALFTFLWLGNRTFVDVITLFRTLAVCCVVGNVLPYAWSGLRLGMEKLEWFFFNLLCIGPMSVCLLLALNHYVHGPVRWTEGGMGQEITVQVGDPGATRSFVLGRDTFYFSETERAASTSGRCRVGVARGCLGYWSVVAAEPLP